MSNKIEELEPELQGLALALLQNGARAGLLLRITQTRRTFAEQQEIYDEGRALPGEPCHHFGEQQPRAVGTCKQHPLGATVTAAGPGWSWHNYGRAFDVCENDNTPYDAGRPGHLDDDNFWEKVGGLGESLGLEWGGRWKHPDRPHFEYHPGLTLVTARMLAKAAGLLA